MSNLKGFRKETNGLPGASLVLEQLKGGLMEVQ